MKKKSALLITLVSLFLAGCNPIESVTGFFNGFKKKDETHEEPQPTEQEPIPEPEPQPEPEPEPEPQPEPEPDPEPVPFTFDQIQYELQDGVDRSEIEGNPWINSNLAGQLSKIKKPSLKDDFYASVNYDSILNHELGIFEKSDRAVREAFEMISDETSGVGNSKLFSRIKNGVIDGNCVDISAYLANFDYDSFVNSESLFVSPNSFFTLEKDDENKYYVSFNDGYVYGTTSFGTIGVFSQLTSQRKAIVDELCDAFGITLTSEELSNVDEFDYDTVETTYESYWYNGGSAYSKFVFGQSKTNILDNALYDAGLTSEDDIYINAATLDAIKRIKYYNPEVRENALKLRLAFELRFLAGAEHYKNISEQVAQTGLFGEQNLNDATDDVYKTVITRKIMPEAFERGYLEIEGDPEKKDLVTNLIIQIIEKYKDTVDTYDWLDEQTKSKVYTKLDKMTFDSCYSDKMKAYPLIDETNISSISLLEIYQRYQSWLYNLKKNNLFEDNPTWQSMPSYTVNAFYNPTTNSFSILNGILGGISKDGRIEEVLGSIGTVIGHEISHSIDSTGSLFDENGNYTNWWTSASKKQFNKKIDNMISFYNQIGVLNDLTVNGENVNGEATADMGGVHMCLEIAKDIDNFDYDLFFKTYAKVWLTQPRNLNEIPYRNQDSHPFEYLRVNATLSQFDEFFETYHIRYGDKMYIPEDQRIAIW